MLIHDCSDEELYCRFGYKQGVGREYATHGSIGHASEETYAGTVVAPGIEIFDRLGACNDGCDQNRLSNHPNDELASTKKCKKLIKVVCRFSDGPENGNKHSASTD